MEELGNGSPSKMRRIWPGAPRKSHKPIGRCVCVCVCLMVRENSQHTGPLVARLWNKPFSIQMMSNTCGKCSRCGPNGTHELAT